MVKTVIRLGALALCLSAWAPVQAAVVTFGQQDFNNGDILTLAGYNAAQVGEPGQTAFNGSDPAGPAFNVSWTFNFAPGAVSSAQLALGIFDHDSLVAGSQIQSFMVDGVNLTASLNALFEASGGDQSEYNIYSLALSGAALAALSDGLATFTLVLQGPSNSGLPSNGAGLDFSTLTTTNVPLPATLALSGLGLALLGAQRRRAG